MTMTMPDQPLPGGAALLREHVGRGGEVLGAGPEVLVELWAVMADPTGAFLVSTTTWEVGGPWTARVPNWAGKEGYHAAALGLLELHDLDEQVELHVLHSTGWRPTDAGLMLPYVAVVGAAGDDGGCLAYERFPTEGPRRHPGLGARPVGKPLYDAAGGPHPHGATERPAPRDLDQLWNCLEHLRHLRDHNDAVRGALDRWWHLALEDWHAVLGGAGLYGTWVRGQEVTADVRA
jgi:hypothetical protein